MRHHEMNSQQNFIAGFYIDDDEQIDDIIKHHDDGNQRTGEIGSPQGNVVNPEKKESIDVQLNDDMALTVRYIESLNMAMQEYNKLYPESDRTAPWGVLEVINVQRYDPPSGGYHSWHSERVSGKFPVALRHLVFMTYLNDVREGGETEWKFQNIKVKPERGLTVIWPSDWTFTHRGLVAPEETKIIVTGWTSFQP